MAIFRAGKRVGPFDIRIGFPRDKSLDNVDRDPRLREHANTENTIGRFRASMAKAEGYARTARFVVRVNLPTNLGAFIEANTDVVAGRTLGNSPAASTAMSLQQISSQMSQQMSLHCDSVSMPGHDLQAQEVQHASAPARSMVQSHGYAGTINASFYADKYLRERHFFEMWQKMCVDNVTHKANYYDEYVGSMEIYQLGSFDGEGDRDVPTYGIKATEVYPTTIAAIDYNYANSNQIAKVNVSFAYKQWYNLTTDAIAGMEFGSSQQTLHDIKSMDRGWFGNLPPELQRTARSVFNQAKNQLPIGKLFKGKVFPPFT
jgi:hypothetical protein